ncbi:MAG: pyridoxine 5'-phosphate synthase [Acidobacteria bacterium RIFCSPLOWO2_02_FULL_67_36]|nr:MAG: pyridoxine 5'-phosphate synthase [Acidobacteria bacterium RIFCSPLOWO2_02_FULL_67_36]OFW19043.1 MAG: pyridoxine 5'-phosphate synthase [Acidobacteria bacterium RIFCSPLOWO2_12_FULL_66_21]
MRLAVNIDHIATLREARKAREPEPVAAALVAEMAGAQGITVHLRSDRRHIKERDLELLRHAIATKLNVEMAVTSDMARVAQQVRPDQVTLVPERPQELTTEGGLDVVLQAAAVKDFIRQMHEAGIRVSIFLDADADQVRKAKTVGADALEINTGRYAEASESARAAELARIADAARLAARHELEVLAGHGLNYTNVIPIAGIAEIAELNIGHAVIARAAIAGLDRAVRDMVALLGR